MRRFFFALLPVVMLFRFITPCFGVTVDRVLAVVDDRVITLSDYNRFIARIDQKAEEDKVDERYLKTLIEESLILQDAKRKGYDATEDEITQSIVSILKQTGMNEEEFEKRIAAENLSLAEYRSLVGENITSMKYIEKEVNSKVIVSNSDLSRYYEKRRGLFLESPEKALVMAIFMRLSSAPSLSEITDLKIRALRVYSEIMNGESFERQVQKHADESVKSLGGILGEFEKGALIPILDSTIFFMKEGEVSEPVWTKEGVYIIKIAKRTGEVYTSLERVKDKLYAEVFDEKREEAFNLWMKALWERSSIKILPR